MEYIDQEQVSDICVLSPRKISCNKMEEHLNTLVDLRWKNNWVVNEYLNSSNFRKDWEEFCILHNLQSVKWECSVENIDAALKITNWYKNLSKNILSIIKAIKKANELALKTKDSRDNYHIKLSKSFLNYAKTWNGSFSLDLVYSSIIWWSVDIWKMNWDLLINLLKKSNLEDRNNLVSIYEKIDYKPKNLSFKLLKIIIKMWYIDNVSKFFNYLDSCEILKEFWFDILDSWNEKSLEILFNTYNEIPYPSIFLEDNDTYFSVISVKYFNQLSEKLIDNWYRNLVFNNLEKIDDYRFHISSLSSLHRKLFDEILENGTIEEKEKLIDIFIRQRVRLEIFDNNESDIDYSIKFMELALNLWETSYLIWEISRFWLENIAESRLKLLLEFDNLEFNQELLKLYKWLKWKQRRQIKEFWSLLKEYFKKLENKW